MTSQNKTTQHNMNFREGFLITTASGLLISQLSLMVFDLEKTYGQLLKNFEVEGFPGTPETSLKMPLYGNGYFSKHAELLLEHMIVL